MRSLINSYIARAKRSMTNFNFSIFYIVNRFSYFIIIFHFFFSSCLQVKTSNNLSFKNGVLDLVDYEFTSNGNLYLSGEWEFYWKNFYFYEDFKSGNLKKTDLLTLPGDWKNHKNISSKIENHGYGTYLLKIYSNRPLNLFLKVNNIFGAYMITLNGIKVASNGTLSSIKDLNVPERLIQINNFNLKKGENLVLLQVSNYDFHRGGFGEILIGSKENIYDSYYKNSVIELFGSGALLILGIYHIGFSLRRKREKYLLYYGIFCLFFSLRMIITGEAVIKNLFGNISFESEVVIEYLSFYLAAPFIVLYINELYPKDKHQKMTNLFMLMTVILSLSVFILPVKLFSATIDFMRIISILYIFYSSYIVIVAIINKRYNSKSLGVIYLVLIGFVLHEILRNLGIFSSISYLNLGFLIFSFAQGYLLSGELAREISNFEEVSGSLEKIVKERTQELERSNIKAIKAKEEIETINSITLKILDSHSLEETLYHIFDYILDRYPFDGLALYFVDNQKKIAYPYKVRGKNLSDSNYNFLKTYSVNLRDSESLFTSALNRGKITYLPKMKRKFLNKITDSKFINTFQSKSFLYVPVRVENRAYSMFMGTTNRKQLDLKNDDLISISRFVSQITGVVQKVRLLEETNLAKMEAEKQRKETEDLNSLIKSLNEDQNIKVIMQKLFDYIQDKYDLNYYGLGILSSSKDALEFKNMKLPSHLQKQDKDKIESMPIPLNEKSNGLHAVVYKKKKTMYINKVREHGTPEEIEILRMCKFKNYIIIPLVLQGELIGVLDLASDSDIKINKNDIVRLSILGEQLAGIVHSSNLVKKIQKEKDKVESARIETEILNSLLKRINDTNDIYRIAMEIFAYTHVVYQFKNYALFLISQDGETMSLVDSNILENLSESEQETLFNSKIPIVSNKGAHGYVMAKKKLTYIPTIRKKFAVPEENSITEMLNIKSLFIIPLVLHNNVIGFLDFTNHDEKLKLSPSDKTKLSILGEQVAGAIFNSNLLKEVKEEKQKVESAMRALQNAQNQLIESGKMAALGQLVAGVAHELNTPIGAIKATAENMRVSLIQTFNYLPELIRELPADLIFLARELVNIAVNSNEFVSTKDERKIKRELRLNLEKQGIDIASDIADTIVDIKIFYLEEKYNALWSHERRREILRMVYDLAGLQIKVKNVESAVDKTSKIVYALKNYSHRENSMDKKEANIIDGIETVIVIYQNYIKKGIIVEKQYENIPNILCYKDELNQIWTNLIHNSIQAMNGEGTIKINVSSKNQYFENIRRQTDYIEVSIEDNGPGIPADVLPKIFNPFFTTKKAGEGTGLGLHLCKEIIEKHDGIIDVNSIPGRTEFIIKIPII
jgi:signal transduction histidine kinase/putative methionine-R-sulfoxide reductase with GAF domain